MLIDGLLKYAKMTNVNGLIHDVATMLDGTRATINGSFAIRGSSAMNGLLKPDFELRLITYCILQLNPAIDHISPLLDFIDQVEKADYIRFSGRQAVMLTPSLLASLHSPRTYTRRVSQMRPWTFDVAEADLQTESTSFAGNFISDPKKFVRKYCEFMIQLRSIVNHKHQQEQQTHKNSIVTSTFSSSDTINPGSTVAQSVTLENSTIGDEYSRAPLSSSDDDEDDQLIITHTNIPGAAPVWNVDDSDDGDYDRLASFGLDPSGLGMPSIESDLPY